MKTQAENTLVDLETGDNVMMVVTAKGQPVSRVVEVVEIKARAIVVDANGYGKLTFRRKTGEAWNATDSAIIRLLTDEEARQYKLATEAVPATAPAKKTAKRFALVSLVNVAHKGQDWCVHVDGCADVAKAVKQHAEVLRTGTLDELEAWFNEGFGEDGGFDDPWLFGRDVDFAPCAVKAPKTKPTPIVGTCYCGCGQAISGKAYFRMGHDMRLHGRLGKVHTQTDFEALKAEIPLALEPSFLATFHKGQFAHLPTIKTVEVK